MDLAIVVVACIVLGWFGGWLNYKIKFEPVLKDLKRFLEEYKKTEL